MTPEPISWDLRSPVSENRRGVKRVSMAKVDKLKSHLESLPQRPKQSSAGGDMMVYSSKSGEVTRFAPVVVAASDAYPRRYAVCVRQ